MREQADRERYRRLPDPVPPEELVETVDTASRSSRSRSSVPSGTGRVAGGA